MQNIFVYQENILHPDSQDPECSETQYVFTLNIGLGPMGTGSWEYRQAEGGVVMASQRQENI